jgi:hypothetical protein
MTPSCRFNCCDVSIDPLSGHCRCLMFAELDCVFLFCFSNCTWKARFHHASSDYPSKLFSCLPCRFLRLMSQKSVCLVVDTVAEPTSVRLAYVAKTTPSGVSMGISNLRVCRSLDRIMPLILSPSRIHPYFISFVMLNK